VIVTLSRTVGAVTVGFFREFVIATQTAVEAAVSSRDELDDPWPLLPVIWATFRKTKELPL
jgi:hypothetical protein